MNLPNKELKLTAPQLIFLRSQHKYTSLEWGRGSGKSTILAWRIKEIVKHLPRAKCGIVGSTYSQILSRTLPSTIEGLEMLGFKKDFHYVVGKRPPKEWKFPEAYQPPLTYDNYMSWYNGTGFQFISLDNADSGRGLNIDAVLGDEAALFDETKLFYNVLLSNRGLKHTYNNHWLHHSVLFTSTTPVSITGNGRWFINREEIALRNPDKHFHLIASSLYNLENLGADYFRELKRTMPSLIYNAEVLCVRNGKPLKSFYPNFSSLHHGYQSSNDNYLFALKYDMDKLRKPTSQFYSDVNPNQALDIAFDYGSAINTLAVGQKYGDKEYRVVKAMHNNPPEKLSDLAQDFCEYFSGHIKKEVHYYYDHTSIGTDAIRTVSFADEVISTLKKNGWRVIGHYVGKAPNHGTKFLFFQKLLSEEDTRLPVLRINKIECPYLIVSIEQAGAYEGNKGIQKDKRPEHRDNAVHEETTHYSDAFDTLVFFKLKDGLTKHGYMVQAVA